ncbi:hypothetical protein GUJ93_ZPchr0003g17334 [Zizania palustris]|uniref:AB hydrolase-1 domain-containing protein n=1 Tax=Zizania palustris TaxID=103762 RepID=A0A8J5VD17_ZIZPA|nr:hypothetical protein GUJ93_ZPchr0003g17334 [Zizania palustris]
MDQRIEHSYLSIRGLKLHIAHVGKGETATLLFVHGFPEVWYSWRHQMVAAAAAGFRAIAPDFPGYGLSEPPVDLAQASWEGLMSDLLGILDSLSISKVFLVAKDFGVKPAYDLALCHPDRVCSVVTIGVPPLVESLDFSGLPEGFYIYRWREPGRPEADFGRFDTRRIIRTIYTLFSKSEIPIAKQGQEIMDLADESTPMPQWFTEEDLSAYTDLYEKSGLMTAIQIPYRTNAAKAECAKSRFEMPMLVIMGHKDYILEFPALKEYMSSEKLKEIAPDCEITYIPEGSHFVQEQFPDHVNQLMIDFINKHV